MYAVAANAHGGCVPRGRRTRNNGTVTDVVLPCAFSVLVRGSDSLSLLFLEPKLTHFALSQRQSDPPLPRAPLTHTHTHTHTHTALRVTLNSEKSTTQCVSLRRPQNTYARKISPNSSPLSSVFAAVDLARHKSGT